MACRYYSGLIAFLIFPISNFIYCFFQGSEFNIQLFQQVAHRHSHTYGLPMVDLISIHKYYSWNLNGETKHFECDFYEESGVVTIFAKGKNIANTFVFLSFTTPG